MILRPRPSFLQLHPSTTGREQRKLLCRLLNRSRSCLSFTCSDADGRRDGGRRDGEEHLAADIEFLADRRDILKRRRRRRRGRSETGRGKWDYRSWRRGERQDFASLISALEQQPTATARQVVPCVPQFVWSHQHIILTGGRIRFVTNQLNEFYCNVKSATPCRNPSPNAAWSLRPFGDNKKMDHRDKGLE